MLAIFDSHTLPPLNLRAFEPVRFILRCTAGFCLTGIRLTIRLTKQEAIQ